VLFFAGELGQNIEANKEVSQERMTQIRRHIIEELK